MTEQIRARALATVERSAHVGALDMSRFPGPSAPDSEDGIRTDGTGKGRGTPVNNGHSKTARRNDTVHRGIDPVRPSARLQRQAWTRFGLATFTTWNSVEQDTYTVSNVEASGDTVTWDHVWTNEHGVDWRAEGHTATITDGKILAWTFAPNP